MQIVNPQTRAAALALSLAALSVPTWAGAPTVTKHGEWIAHDFKFHGGEVLSELHIRYTTVGERSGEPVLILHGTGDTGDGLLTQEFAGRLFGPGQPLDAAKYFIILPDAIGHGGSSKPSDGLRMRFPKYDYDDQVEAEHRLLNEGLGVHHLRLVAGISMGGNGDLALGRKISPPYGRARANGGAASAHGEPELDAATANDRDDPQRPRMDERRV